MNDIEIKNALDIPLSENEKTKQVLQKVFDDIMLDNETWKKNIRDWYMWEFEYKPMFCKNITTRKYILDNYQKIYIILIVN